MQDVRQQVKTLTAINTQDMLTSFGLGEVRRGRWFLDLACWLPALRFARQSGLRRSRASALIFRLPGTRLVVGRRSSGKQIYRSKKYSQPEKS